MSPESPAAKSVAHRTASCATSPSRSESEAKSSQGPCSGAGGTRQEMGASTAMRTTLSTPQSQAVGLLFSLFPLLFLCPSLLLEGPSWFLSRWLLRGSVGHRAVLQSLVVEVVSQSGVARKEQVRSSSVSGTGRHANRTVADAVGEDQGAGSWRRTPPQEDRRRDWVRSRPAPLEMGLTEVLGLQPTDDPSGVLDSQSSMA